MKTSELPIGAHVAFDVYQSRDSHSFVEAYVVAHRPRGNKSSYWGERTGNTDTIGIMYTRPNWDSNPANPTIRVQWVRPADLHMTWAEYVEIETAAKQRQAEQLKIKKAAQKNRKQRFNALPEEVRALFAEYQVEYLIDRDNINVSVNMAFLENLVKAAQNGHPAIKQATVAAEVEAALSLLG